MFSDDLFEFAGKVGSRDDFLKFLNYLKKDLENNDNEWENNNIKDYIKAIFNFTSDIEGYYKNMGESVDAEAITWRMVSQILLAAKVYGS